MQKGKQLFLRVISFLLLHVLLLPSQSSVSNNSYLTPHYLDKAHARDGNEQKFCGEGLSQSSISLSLSLSFSEAAANIILYLSLPDLTVCPFGVEVNVKIPCY